MIYYADSNLHIENMKKFCSSDTESVCSARILCLYNSYSSYKNMIRLWVQYNDNGSAVSAISENGGNITVYSGENADIEEISEFLKVLGYSSVLSEKEIFPESKTNIIMTFKRKAFSENKNNYFIDTTPNLNQVYSILKSCEDDSFIVPKYEDFISDTSHRLRHNTAICCGIHYKNNLSAFAMTTALTDETAVIGAVSVLPEYRRQGLGSACIISLIKRLDNRKVFVIRDIEKNGKFYKNLGFEEYGTAFVKVTD